MDAAPPAGRLDPSFWRQTLAPYSTPDPRRAMIDAATSVVPYLLLTAIMYGFAGDSVALVLALSIPATGFLLRTFIRLP